MAEHVPVLVTGAGPAGLATAACLHRRGVQACVVDQAPELGSSWHAHYERLHLHTVKSHSALPGMPFPAHYPRYVPRRQMAEYLQAYAAHFGIAPRLQQQVAAIAPDAAGAWEVRMADGSIFRAEAVVVASGANRKPRIPDFPHQETFTGNILHSASYRSAEAFSGQRVLVVGMGNTGAEIALDLAEHGAKASLAVRSPLNIVHRDVLGRPTQLSALMLSRLPLPLGDALARLLRDLTVGDLGRWGIRTAPLSPLRQLREQGKTPVIDIGTLARIRRGEIVVYPGIARFDGDEVHFTDGRHLPFDAVVLATGYAPRLQELFAVPLQLDANGMPASPLGTGALSGVYFVGFDLRAPGGLLHTIARQAEQVAEAIASQRQDTAGR